MAKEKYEKNKSSEIKRSKFDKVIFIFAGSTTLVFFILGLIPNVFPLNATWQIICGLITVLSAFFTIISFFFDNKFKKLEEKILEAQKSTEERILTAQNSIENIQESLIIKLRDDLDDRLSYLHDLYNYQASENIDFKEYAQKEVEKLILKLNSLCSNGESEILAEGDYYKKLHQLADKIVDDQFRYTCLDTSKKQTISKPIIWALTCFNEDEWGEEKKSEDEWSDRLEKLTADYGVSVERICILSEEIKNFIKSNDNNTFLQKISKNKHIASFMGFLSRYYNTKCIDKYKESTVHYAFFDNISSELVKTRGFFGICLSNGEKHIVKGDCNAEKNEFTAKIVFNCNNLYDEFVDKKQHRLRLEIYLNSNASPAFKEFLKSKNINIET